MKNTEIKKITAAHTNRLLISTAVSLSLLLILMLINRGQSYSQTILQTQNAVMVLSVLSIAAAVVMSIVAVVSKKKFLVEYIALAVVMAFCFFCIHGVNFVTIKLMKYITAAILVAYLVASFAYHTIVPKMLKK